MWSERGFNIKLIMPMSTQIKVKDWLFAFLANASPPSPWFLEGYKGVGWTIWACQIVLKQKSCDPLKIWSLCFFLPAQCSNKNYNSCCPLHVASTNCQVVKLHVQFEKYASSRSVWTLSSLLKEGYEGVWCFNGHQGRVGRYLGLLPQHLSLKSIFIEGTFESIFIEFSHLRQIYSLFISFLPWHLSNSCFTWGQNSPC